MEAAARDGRQDGGGGRVGEALRAITRLALARAVEAGDPVEAAAQMDRHFDESVRALLAAGPG